MGISLNDHRTGRKPRPVVKSVKKRGDLPDNKRTAYDRNKRSAVREALRDVAQGVGENAHNQTRYL